MKKLVVVGNGMVGLVFRGTDLELELKNHLVRELDKEDISTCWRSGKG